MSAQVASERLQRLEVANQIIQAVASCGRHFLSMNSDVRQPIPDARVSRFEFVNGRLWYIDKWRESRIFVHYDPARRGGGWSWRFSDGGTLLSLLKNLRDYIVKGSPLNPAHFGPFSDWCCGGDPWGYGDDMTILREKISAIHAEAQCP